MIQFLAMQVILGKITLEMVPIRYREKVANLLKPIEPNPSEDYGAPFDEPIEELETKNPVGGS